MKKKKSKEYLTRSLPYELISLSICTIADSSSALDRDHQILYYAFRFRYIYEKFCQICVYQMCSKFPNIFLMQPIVLEFLNMISMWDDIMVKLVENDKEWQTGELVKWRSLSLTFRCVWNYLDWKSFHLLQSQRQSMIQHKCSLEIA